MNPRWYLVAAAICLALAGGLEMLRAGAGA